MMEGGESINLGPKIGKVGTFRWLSVEWFKSVEFERLAPITCKEHRRLLEHMLREPSSPGSAFLFGDYPASRLEFKHVKVLRDRKKDVASVANHRINTLNVMFRWAIENDNLGGVKVNPARDVPLLKISSDGHHPWTDSEREDFKKRFPIGTMARLAYELFWNTGQRLGDVRNFGRHLIRNNKLCFTQDKNHDNPRPVYLELDILPDLKVALDATKTGDLRFLLDTLNKPFRNKDAFGKWFRKRCDEAGLPQCSAHGLRKASATFYAELGASASELMAIFGWKSLRAAEGYVRAANQKKLASRAMGRVKSGT
jgi:integrase